MTFASQRRSTTGTQCTRRDSTCPICSLEKSPWSLDLKPQNYQKSTFSLGFFDGFCPKLLGHNSILWCRICPIDIAVNWPWYNIWECYTPLFQGCSNPFQVDCNHTSGTLINFASLSVWKYSHPNRDVGRARNHVFDAKNHSIPNFISGITPQFWDFFNLPCLMLSSPSIFLGVNSSSDPRPRLWQVTKYGIRIVLPGWLMLIFCLRLWSHPFSTNQYFNSMTGWAIFHIPIVKFPLPVNSHELSQSVVFSVPDRWEQLLSGMILQRV